MCELFGMSSRFPATVRLSLEEFSRRGGMSGPHKDGWGIAYYAGNDVRLMKEPAPASDSACIRFVQEHPPASTLVISHIRRATQGDRAYRNCQPFTRELGGRTHVFAHNGHLDGSKLRRGFLLGGHRPLGETDSEHAFCALLERLRALWLRNDDTPPLTERLAVVSRFADELRPLGPANFLYADGEALFLHGHKRTQAGGEIQPPGLYVLCRSCAAEVGGVEADGLSIDLVAGDQHVALAASVPLTGEPGWQPLVEGEIVVARSGEILARVLPGEDARFTPRAASRPTG